MLISCRNWDASISLRTSFSSIMHCCFFDTEEIELLSEARVGAWNLGCELIRSRIEMELFQKQQTAASNAESAERL